VDEFVWFDESNTRESILLSGQVRQIEFISLSGEVRLSEFILLPQR